MTINQKDFEEKYKIDPKWLDKNFMILQNAPKEVKERYWAYDYITFGIIPYEGYVFPYSSTGIESKYEKGGK